MCSSRSINITKCWHQFFLSHLQLKVFVSFTIRSLHSPIASFSILFLPHHRSTGWHIAYYFAFLLSLHSHSHEMPPPSCSKTALNRSDLHVSQTKSSQPCRGARGGHHQVLGIESHKENQSPAGLAGHVSHQSPECVEGLAAHQSPHLLSFSATGIPIHRINLLSINSTRKSPSINPAGPSTSLNYQTSLLSPSNLTLINVEQEKS